MEIEIQTHENRSGRWAYSLHIAGELPYRSTFRFQKESSARKAANVDAEGTKALCLNS